MSKGLVDLLMNDTRLNEQATIIDEIYQSNKPVRVATVKPPKPTDDEKDLAKQGMLVQVEVNDVEYVINPLTLKWSKKNTLAGRLIVALVEK